MVRKHKKSSKNLIWVVSAAVALAILGGGFYLVKVLISDGVPRKGRQMHMVTLLKPPPPPPVREKPPEPKVEEKKEIIKTEPDTQPQQDDQAKDDAPAGEQLGVDAEGSAGSDAFGLMAKKGGRPLIGGSSADQSLLRKYAWYTQIIQEEIRKKVREHLDRDGGIPDGNLKTLVRVTLDRRGYITGHTILASSGSHKMDEAVAAALKVMRLSEPPPDGMPTTLKLRITSQG